MATSKGLSIVDQLKKNIRLVDLSERLGLIPKRSGKDHKALCPFHNDKTPSLHLYDDNQGRFHCYACGANGDIFHLTQQVKGTDFSGAVDWLVEEYHIDYSKRIPSIRNRKTKKVTAINASGLNLALDIYLRKTERTDLEGWFSNRQLPSSLIDKAHLSLTGQNTLTNEIELNGNREMLGILEDANLIRRNFHASTDEKRYFLNLIYPTQDFFNSRRIIFPIYDVIGSLQGFAGRLFDEVIVKDGPPKYLYTPKLPRSELLYRSEQAFKRIKTNALKDKHPKTLYLCEGLLDALRLESLDLPAVSLLGAQASDKQINHLSKLNDDLSGALRCAVFLDKDTAGQRGAAKTITKLTEIGIETVYIWATSKTPETKFGKDPEEILRGIPIDLAEELLNDWTHPAILALISERLRVPPDDILDDTKWNTLSSGRRYWAISDICKCKNYFFLINQLGRGSHWQRDISDYSLLLKESPISIKSQKENESDNQRLALAVDLAEAGTRRGELPSDTAAWRRIETASTAFYEAFKMRLKQNTGLPLEPFEAVYVSRGFGKTEYRLKTMPCPEDLIVQQYLLNDLLHDQISSFVPAVRYYRGENRTVTTCETNIGEIGETLSFAYQIDMDVIHGRRPPTDQGMFRHYFECWQEFNTSIKQQCKGMSQVHYLRLDLSRYYDNLRRLVVRDVLRKPMRILFDELENNELIWFSLFQPYSDNRADRLVDWLCDQSFGYSHYRPDTGEAKAGEEFKGIPQGPVLSSWLATVALFPMDAALRQTLEKYNNEGQKKVGYARYVDDVIILADSQELLDILRATAEDAANSLFVELRQKGDPTPPMRQDEFIRNLTEGRSLPEYGPMEEFELTPFDFGDGETGWSLWHGEEVPPRYAALHLLRDARLYTATTKLLLNQIHTALQADELRPGELGKASRWLWYAAAFPENTKNNNEIWSCYWDFWGKVIRNTAWELDIENCPWDDPAFYALEGLEKLLESSLKSSNHQLSTDDEARRKECIVRLSHFVGNANFIDEFVNTSNPDLKPKHWGQGIKKLPRQFWQRAICLHWKARRLSSDNNATFPDISMSNDLTLRASLVRAWLTNAETCQKKPPQIANKGISHSINPLREAMLLLHEAYVLMGVQDDQTDNDLLSEITISVQQVKQAYKIAFPSQQETSFINLLGYLPPAIQIQTEDNSKYAADLALVTLANIAPRNRLMSLLANRPALLGSIVDASPLPPLPGIPLEQLLLITPEPDVDHSQKIIDSIHRIRRQNNGQNLEQNLELNLWVLQANEQAKPVILEWKITQIFGEYILETDMATLNRTHTIKYCETSVNPNEPRKTQNLYSRIQSVSSQACQRI